METKYGTIPYSQLLQNSEDLINRIFSLLPKKEKGYPNLQYEITSLLFRINGMNKLLNQPPELFTVMCLLEAAKDEPDFHLYRKAILDSCSIIHNFVDRPGDA